MDHYEIIVNGHIDRRWNDWFQGLEITLLPEGQSLLNGEITDQAELHGILNRIRDMGLKLVSVQRKDYRS